jgi:undecaprenyl-diphosphatase
VSPGPHPSGEPLDLLTAALLGAIQGATEFLPVSSSGHLALAQSWLGVDPSSAGHRFAIIVHAGTLLAVIWAYRADLRRLLSAALSRGEPRDRHLMIAVMVGTLPLGLVLVPGFTDAAVALASNVRAVGVALLITAGLLVATRRTLPGEGDPSLRTAFLVGLGQLGAVAPGISRSGTTIAVALLLGVGRPEAARFSFLLSIPAITGATVLAVKDLLQAPAGTVDPGPLLVGFGTSLVVGLAALYWLLHLVNRGRLWLFVPYLLVVGTIAAVVGS